MILIIGAGSIGKRHLANLVDLGARELAVVDPREDRRREADERARLTLEQINPARRGDPLRILTFASTEEAYARAGNHFQQVVIATPPPSHPSEIRRALAAGAAVFCEKPLATDEEPWEELARICAEVEQARRVTLVAYNYRFSPQLLQVRRMLQEGAVGRVLSIRGTFSENLREWHPWEGLNFYMSSLAQGGGALLDESHAVDLCRWLFGEITEVMGYNEAVSNLKSEPVFEADDLAEILVRFESGAIGSLHMDLFGRHHQKRLEVIGEEGTLFWHFDNTDIESNGIELWKGRRIRMSPEFTRRLPEQVIPTDWSIRNGMYREEIRYFLESAKAGRHLRSDVPDLRDALRTMAVLRAARRAARSRHAEAVQETLAPQTVR